MIQSFAILFSVLASGCGVLGQEEEEEVFRKDSFAIFEVTACPWYHFSSSGVPILPRGPSKVGDECRSKTLRHYMKNFREGKTFAVMAAGTELFAHAGGTHDQGNDGDLDTVMVDVVPAQPSKGSFLQARCKNSTNVLTGSLSMRTVRLHTRVGEICMAAGGYGQETLTAAPFLSEAAKNYIQNDLCLCQADGVQTICAQKDHWGDGGMSAWIPLPESKNLGRALETYIGLGEDTWAGWRSGSLEGLKHYDTDSNGEISLIELLHEAPKRGVAQEWIDVIKAEDPCVFVNGQRDANLWFHVLKDIEQHPGQLHGEMERAGVYPKQGGSWDPTTEWVRKKYSLELFSDKAKCRSLMDVAASSSYP
eukprot:CAMPEP_0115499512 /NCGR_PEP_ID=MMETSP0271-20121206/67377_1 /TAXON_ID=71861 /ORGANISM="Scrippsiella trochoidea, Strain CCMP3099" /LENGTH=363 /DNA_ID=CAMNT_0002928331 /DNA_START=50 /DNA_END=1141 /DNA_ORIENTATION=+